MIKGTRRYTHEPSFPTRIANIRKATLVMIGLAISNLLETAPFPKLVMTWTRIRPTTSSIIAAVTRMLPRRVSPSPADRRMANVVPREVEHNDAPDAKAALTLVLPLVRGMRMNDIPMGAAMPEIAIVIDSRTLERIFERGVVKPPSMTLVVSK